MDFNNGTFIALGTAGIVLFVTFLVAVFYKPKKRLKVVAKFNPTNNHLVEVHVKNVGKRRVKTVAPYVKFTHGQISRKYQVNPRKINCKFPRILNIGDEVSFQINLTNFHSVLEQKSMNTTHLKVIIENMVGMQYNSQSLNYKF